MKKEIETGGPAFACAAIDGQGNTYGDSGMDLRDYFAAKAMQALIQTPTAYWPKETSDIVSEAAYEMADAMLDARK